MKRISHPFTFNFNTCFVSDQTKNMFLIKQKIFITMKLFLIKMKTKTKTKKHRNYTEDSKPTLAIVHEDTQSAFKKTK